MPTGSPQLFGTKRRAFQWTVALVVLLVPFVRIGGESLLRLDLATLSVHAGGTTIWIEEFCLFLPLALALVVNLVLERVWRGWACPLTGQRRRVAFAVLSPLSPAGRPLTAIFTLRDERGRVVARQRGLLPAAKE